MILQDVIDPYIVRIMDNTLAPVVFQGDILIVDRLREPKNKDLILCHLNGICLVKQYLTDDISISLRSYHNKNEVRKLTIGDMFDYIGCVVKIVKNTGQ